MGYVFSAPAGLITLFALGIEAAIALILAASNGLSELHKDLLVGFAVGFPALVLVVLLLLLSRADRGQDPTSPEEI
jgi:hypothetical protein